jgi:hypothetical protein
VRITAGPGPVETTQSPAERRKRVKKKRATDQTAEATPTSASGVAPKLTGIGGLIEESQAVKQILRDAFHRVQRLGSALRRHRQQSKTFRAALTSLKQLQQIDT